MKRNSLLLSMFWCDFLHNEPIFGPKRTKSRRMRKAGHVACMGRGEVYTGFWCGNLRERDHLEGPGIDGG